MLSEIFLEPSFRVCVCVCVCTHAHAHACAHAQAVFPTPTSNSLLGIQPNSDTIYLEIESNSTGKGLVSQPHPPLQMSVGNLRLLQVLLIDRLQLGI